LPPISSNADKFKAEAIEDDMKRDKDIIGLPELTERTVKN
jgi:hypothetical protein